jgi:hypothetical protein
MPRLLLLLLLTAKAEVSSAGLPARVREIGCRDDGHVATGGPCIAGRRGEVLLGAGRAGRRDNTRGRARWHAGHCQAAPCSQLRIIEDVVADVLLCIREIGQIRVCFLRRYGSCKSN